MALGFDLYASSFDHENQPSPRVNLIYQPTDSTTLHAGYARYFTPPPLENVPAGNVSAFDNTSNASQTDQDDPVKAERANYFDAGVSQKLAPGLQVGVDGYYKRAKNQLDDGLFGQTLILSAFNYREGEVYGLEFPITYTIGGFSTYANVALSVARGKDWNSAQFLFDPKDLAYVQNNWINLDHDQTVTGSFGASYLWKHDRGSSRVYVDALFGSGLRTDSTTPNGENIPNGGTVPDYYTVGVGFEEAFKLRDKQVLKARLDIANVTDNIYVLRNGSGVGVNAAQYGMRMGIFGTITYCVLAHKHRRPGGVPLFSVGTRNYYCVTLRWLVILLRISVISFRRLPAAAGPLILAASFMAGTVMATDMTNASPGDLAATNNSVVHLPDVVVEGRQDSLLGIADSATEGATGASQLADRPLLRSGEILETVPGVIITQHAGGGKANQYFLRGFNLDHGTDFAVFLDDMPLNLPSHAHGEGYSDMNTVIPEFVERIDYEKGPYYADVGNYGSAGSAHLVFYQTLPQDFVTVEGGMYGYERAVFGLSQKLGAGNLLYGGEAYHDDGPWVNPDDYWKFNGILTYSQGDEVNGWSTPFAAITANGIPATRFPPVLARPISLGPSIRPTAAIRSVTACKPNGIAMMKTPKPQSWPMVFTTTSICFPTSLISSLTRTRATSSSSRTNAGWPASTHATRFSASGLAGTWKTHSVCRSATTGSTTALYQTENRVRVDKLDSATGTILPAVTEADDFTDTQVGFYAGE